MDRWTLIKKGTIRGREYKIELFRPDENTKLYCPSILLDGEYLPFVNTSWAFPNYKTEYDSLEEAERAIDIYTEKHSPLFL